MPNDSLEPQRTRDTVSGILIRVDWALWGALVIMAI